MILALELSQTARLKVFTCVLKDLIVVVIPSLRRPKAAAKTVFDSFLWDDRLNPHPPRRYRCSV